MTRLPKNWRAYLAELNRRERVIGDEWSREDWLLAITCALAFAVVALLVVLFAAGGAS
jgi:hypothetical protein